MSEKMKVQTETADDMQESALLQNKESFHRVELYLKRSRLAVLHTLVLYCYVAYCFFGAVQTSHIAVWLSWMLAVGMLTLLHVNSYDTNQVTHRDSQQYEHRQIALHTLAGLGWSLVGILLINDTTPMMLVYLAFTINGILISLAAYIMAPSILGLVAYTFSASCFTAYYTLLHFETLNLFFWGSVGLITTVMLIGREAYLHIKHYISLLMRNELMNKKLNASNQVLNQHANVDELTGLHNRRFILEDYYQKVSSAKRYHQALSILLIDIDFFKKVNDQHGHILGDEVLIAVALNLANGLRESDLIGRYGGEEFLALLPMTDLVEAQIIAERLRMQVANHSSFQEKYGFCVTVSIGLVQLSSAETGLELIARVDKALYAAKNNGRNRVELS